MVFFNSILLSIFLALNFSGENLIDLIEKTNGLLSDIETDKEIIYQQFSYDQEQPFNVEFIKTVEKIKDGKQKTETFLLNLALINDNNIEIKSSKNKMMVRLESQGGKYIQKYEEGESKGFVNFIEIQSSDIDVARELKDILDDAIPIARSAWEEAIDVPDQLADLNVWMSEYVVDVAGGKKIWTQSLQASNSFDDYNLMDIQEEGKEMSSYHFSWSVVDPKSIKVTPSGDLVKMEFKTKSNKRHFTLDSEKGRSFQNKATLYFEDAARALELAKGIEKAIEYSMPIAENREASYKDCSDCIQQLSSSISGYAGKSWTTNMNAACEAELNYQKAGKEDVETYNFYWSDMNVKSLKQDYNTSELKLSLETLNKQKFISKTVNGEVKGYESKIELLFDDLETFSKAKYQVENIIGNCTLDLQPESIEWMNGNFTSSAINEMEQSIAAEEGDVCSLVFNAGKVDSDKSDAFDFNLYDIDPNRLNMKIRGSKLQLELNTNKNEKIITKTNQDGKLEYTNKLTMDFSDITTLRVGKMTIEKAINGCQSEK